MTAPIYDDNLLYTSAPGTMRTVSGLRVDPLNLKVDEINLEDIGHALALQCRYNGHSHGHLSVARHSVWVSYQPVLDTIELKLWGLLHDAAEAYLGDMIRPLKHRDGVADAYLAAEARAEQIIAARFGLLYPMPDEVKQADNIVSHAEITEARFTWDSTWQEDETVFRIRFMQLQTERLKVTT
jgi:uncharacterized protein